MQPGGKVSSESWPDELTNGHGRARAQEGGQGPDPVGG